MRSNKMRLNKKGAFSVTALIMGVITLIIYVAFIPTLNTIISTAIPDLDDMSALIISLFPLILLLMIIVGVVSYGKPNYEYL
jgi:hypothetical protein